jgi:uncharacterized repeat protein (TIGR01451 family)
MIMSPPFLRVWLLSAILTASPLPYSVAWARYVPPLSPSTAPATSSTQGSRELKIKTKAEKAKQPAKPVDEWPGKSKRWALVIGVDDYGDGLISKLSGASNDAESLAEALKQYADFPKDQVILLTSKQHPSKQPKRNNILLFLSNLRGQVPKDGLLLVAFAGHGIERGGRAYLLPSDAVSANDVGLLEDTAVSVEVMKQRIRDTGVGQVIFILDTCRDDPAATRGTGNNPMSASFSRSFNFNLRNRDVKAFVTLYAGSVGQRAYEYAEKQQGYFTWTLIEGLKGDAANGKGEVMLANLVRYVEERVPKLVRRDFGVWSRQEPYHIIEGYKAEDLVIAVVERPASGVAAGRDDSGTQSAPNVLGVATAPPGAVKLTAREVSVDLSPGQSVLLSYMLTNTGAREERFRLETDLPADYQPVFGNAPSAPAGASVFVTPTLKRGASVNVLLNVRAPETATEGQQRRFFVTAAPQSVPGAVVGTADATLTVKSPPARAAAQPRPTPTDAARRNAEKTPALNVRGEESERQPRAASETALKQTPNLRLALRRAALTAQPGQSIQLPLVITNTGNKEDQFRVETDMPAEFQPSFTQGDAATGMPVLVTPQLRPGASLEVTLSLRVPDSAPDNQQQRFLVRAASQADATVTRVSDASLTVAAAALAASSNALQEGVQPGETFTQRISVSNKGSAAARSTRANFVFNPDFELVNATPAPISYDRPSRTAIWALGDLDSRDNREITVTLRAVPEALAGTNKPVGRGTTRTQSLSVPSNFDGPTISVGRVSAARVDAVSKGLTATPGDTLFVPFIIRNPSNYPESFELRIVAPGVPAATIYADANGDGQHQEVEPAITQTASLDPHGGQYPVLLRVDIPRTTADRTQFAYNLVTRAVSSTGRAASEDSTMLTVTAPRVSVRMEGALPAAATPAPANSSDPATVRPIARQQDDVPSEAEQKTFNQGRDLFAQGRYEQAATVFSDFLKKNPNSFISDLMLLWLGRTYIAMGKLKEAEEVGKRINSIKNTPFTKVYEDELQAAREQRNQVGPETEAGAQRGGPDTAAPGDALNSKDDTFSYRLVLTNAGSGAAKNVVVTELLPDALEFVSSEPTLVVLRRAAVGAQEALQWRVSELGPGATATASIAVRHKAAKSNVPASAWQRTVAYQDMNGNNYQSAAVAEKPNRPDTSKDLARSPSPPQQTRLKPLILASQPAAEGSVVSIISDSDNLLKDYSAYRSGDRLYVVIPNADASAITKSGSGRGYSDIQVQQRGRDVVLSFRVQPGATARVAQSFNRLNVIFTVGK